MLSENGFDVVQVCNADEAIEFIEDTDNQAPDIVVVDVMLPPGVRFAGRPDVEDGLRTGVLLYPDLQQRLPTTPILIWTNAVNPELVAGLPEEAQIVLKPEVPPFEFAEVIDKLLREATIDAEK